MKQRISKGFTLISFVLMATLVTVVGLIALKVVPVYINHFAIVRSIKDLDKLPKSNVRQSVEASKSYLKEYLERKLYINEIRFIKKKDMVIKRKYKSYVVSVPYTVQKQLTSQVSLLFKFNPSYEVSIEGE